jgi:hypothetical protein
MPSLPWSMGPWPGISVARTIAGPEAPQLHLETSEIDPEEVPEAQIRTAPLRHFIERGDVALQVARAGPLLLRKIRHAERVGARGDDAHVGGESAVPERVIAVIRGVGEVAERTIGELANQRLNAPGDAEVDAGIDDEGRVAAEDHAAVIAVASFPSRSGTGWGQCIPPAAPRFHRRVSGD